MRHHRMRLLAFAMFGPILFGLFAWALFGLDRFGDYQGAYGLLLNALTVPVRHITNVPTAVNFDFRGVDTMGEEYILFGSVIGTLTLLRGMKEEREEDSEETKKRGRERSDAVRFLGVVLSGLLVLFGIYIIVHAHLTPGGGFQGGAMVGTAALLVYLASEYETYHKVSPKELMEFGHASAAGAYVAIGLLTLVFGGNFLKNVLPLGNTSHFLSGGTIPLINDAVGLEVSIGFALVFQAFIEQVQKKGK